MGTYQERLKAAMSAKKSTITELATALGISYQGVKKVMAGPENGGAKAFGTENNIKAARFLGVSIEWLGTGKGDMHDSTPPSQPTNAGASQHSTESRAHTELSPSAVEIGLLYDMLTDRIERAVVYNDVTKRILDALQQHKQQSSDVPGQAGASQRQPA